MNAQFKDADDSREEQNKAFWQWQYTNIVLQDASQEISDPSVATSDKQFWINGKRKRRPWLYDVNIHPWKS